MTLNPNWLDVRFDRGDSDPTEVIKLQGLIKLIFQQQNSRHKSLKEYLMENRYTKEVLECASIFDEELRIIQK